MVTRHGETCTVHGIFLLQGMLDHRISRDAEHLQGPYAKAFDRICNQVPSHRP
jgi:hypothetical protein